jgi:hypothetical protein
VDIAEDINLAPCLLARFILQCHLGLQRNADPQSQSNTSITRQTKQRSNPQLLSPSPSKEPYSQQRDKSNQQYPLDYL